MTDGEEVGSGEAARERTTGEKVVQGREPPDEHDFVHLPHPNGGCIEYPEHYRTLTNDVFYVLFAEAYPELWEWPAWRERVDQVVDVALSQASAGNNKRLAELIVSCPGLLEHHSRCGAGVASVLAEGIRSGSYGLLEALAEARPSEAGKRPDSPAAQQRHGAYVHLRDADRVLTLGAGVQVQLADGSVRREPALSDAALRKEVTKRVEPDLDEDGIQAGAEAQRTMVRRRRESRGQAGQGKPHYLTLYLVRVPCGEAAEASRTHEHTCASLVSDEWAVNGVVPEAEFTKVAHITVASRSDDILEFTQRVDEAGDGGGGA